MWTNIILALILLGGMSYGFYLMLRVDSFVEEERCLQEQQNEIDEDDMA